jgi:phage terminase large subunit-like protein
VSASTATAQLTRQAAFEGIGVKVEKVRYQLHGATCWIEKLVLDERIRHNGSSLLRWNLTNAVATWSGNAKQVSKAQAGHRGKIDGVAALLTAAHLAMQESHADVGPQLYIF